MLLALTGYETAVLVVAGVFIIFALVVALLVPRSRPEFPAKRLGIFVGVCVLLFAAQMTAVLALAEVGEADEPAHEGTPEPAPTEPPPATTTPTPTETTETDTTETETTESETTETETTETETTETETTEGEGNAVAGKAIFVANCASCHTLADAGTTGTIGPNLDDASPSFDKVVERVTEGKAPMPSFADTLSEQQIADVAAYVSSSVAD